MLPTDAVDWPSHRPRALWSGSADQAARLSETAIAFAGEKWAFWVRFSVAEVMVVSTVAVQERALVMAVSTSPRHSCLCAKKFALLGPMVGASAKNFAQRTKNSPQSAFYGVLGEFCTGLVGERVCWANFVAYTGTVAGYHR